MTRLTYQPECASDVKSLSQVFGIPQRIIRLWQREGYLSRECITADQWGWLELVKDALWSNRTVIRAMLAGLPQAERRRLADDCTKKGVERVVYNDFLRFKLRGDGIMGDGRNITYDRYRKYLQWRHPNLWHLLTRQIFDAQRKSALARIRYARQTGRLEQLMADMGVTWQD
jgi:hypothetical protein